MRISLLSALVTLLVACGVGGDENASEQEETVGAEIANEYNKALDNAHNVENLSFEARDRMDAALEEAEGTDTDQP